MNIFDFSAKTIDGKEISLSEFKGKVLLIVNTASKCGFTKQYDGLQKLYEQYKDKGLEILGFPCNQFLEQEPGTEDEIVEFCKINFGVTFPLFSKIDVKGANAHPLYKYLTETAGFKGFDESTESGAFLSNFLKEKFPETLGNNDIKWNFTKFLINKNGEIVSRFESPIEPSEISSEIEKLF